MGTLQFCMTDNAEKIVIKDFEKLCDAFIKASKNIIKSIYVTGSFGCGEGGYLVNHECFPVSDYDFLIICDYVDEKIFDDIRYSAKGVLPYNYDFFAVDITFATIGSVPNYDLSGYELSKKCKLIWGKDTIGGLAKIDKCALNINTAIFFANNRIKNLLYCLAFPNIYTIRSTVETMYVCHRINNLITALMKALLIKDGRYMCTLRECFSVFKSIYYDKTNWVEAAQEATLSCLYPKPFKFPSVNLWLKYADVFKEMYIYLLNDKGKFLNPKDDETVIISIENAQDLFCPQQHKRMVEKIAAFLLLSFNGCTIKPLFLLKASKLLGISHSYKFFNVQHWEKIRKELIFFRNRSSDIIPISGIVWGSDGFVR